MSSPQSSGFYGLSGGARNATLVLVGFILVSGVAIGAIAYYLLAPRSNPDPTPPPAASSAPSAGAQPALAPCTDPPIAEATSWELTAEGLAIEVDLSSSCAADTVLSSDATSVSASMGNRDIASAVFDLATDPITVGSGDTTSRTFVFPAGMYWRPPELIDGAVSFTVTPTSSDATQAVPSSSGSPTLTAAGPASPAHGSEESTATTVLRELADADHYEVQTSLENRWIPQIGSKRVGLVAEGITWTTVDILRNHLEFRQRYDDVRLVWSADWTTFNSPDFWVTIVAEAFGTADQANRWCDSNGIDAFNCFAKMISSTFGTEGTTVLRE